MEEHKKPVNILEHKFMYKNNRKSNKLRGSIWPSIW